MPTKSKHLDYDGLPLDPNESYAPIDSYTADEFHTVQFAERRPGDDAYVIAQPQLWFRAESRGDNELVDLRRQYLLTAQLRGREQE